MTKTKEMQQAWEELIDLLNEYPDSRSWSETLAKRIHYLAEKASS